jgi:hypothetical protein
MRKLLHSPSPSPALVVATTALVLSMAGTTWAATSLPRNSVGSAQIKNHSVTLGKISTKARYSLRGQAGPAGALGAAGSQGQNGAQGPNGAQGATGPEGSAGPGGATNVTTTTQTFGTGSIAAGGTYINSVTSCPLGQRATGGGGASDNAAKFELASSAPEVRADGQSVGWRTTWFNTSGAAATANVNTYAVCASP